MGVGTEGHCWRLVDWVNMPVNVAAGFVGLWAHFAGLLLVWM